MIRFATSLAAATLILSGGWSAFGNTLAGAASPPVIAHVYAHPQPLHVIAHVYSRKQFHVSPAAISVRPGWPVTANPTSGLR